MDVRRRAPPKDGERAASVVDYVADSNTRRILKTNVRPGQRLVESDIMRVLGEGRGSVREALRRLEMNRYIVYEPNRGAMVAKPTRDELAALFRVREVLSGLGTRAAAERIDEPGHRKIMETLLEDAYRQEKAGKHQNHKRENGVFHRAVNNLSGISHIGDLMDQLNYPLLYSIYFKELTVEVWRRNISDHIDIGRAILNGDATAAEHFGRRHMAQMMEIANAIASGND